MLRESSFPERTDLRLPVGTLDRVRAIARARFTKPAEFMRQAILSALEMAEGDVARLAPPPARRSAPEVEARPLSAF